MFGFGEGQLSILRTLAAAWWSHAPVWKNGSALKNECEAAVCRSVVRSFAHNPVIFLRNCNKKKGGDGAWRDSFLGEVDKIRPILVPVNLIAYRGRCIQLICVYLRPCRAFANAKIVTTRRTRGMKQELLKSQSRQLGKQYLSGWWRNRGALLTLKRSKTSRVYSECHTNVWLL